VFDGKRDRPDKVGAWDHEKGHRRERSHDDRPKRHESKPKRVRADVPLATYSIAVGKRHKVEPRQIVGAIANEGGLNRTDFGHIDIRGDHSLVELPAELAPETWAALERTRISGKLIDLTLENGPPMNKKKPRTKKNRD
jgi:ATP-dependent RNA helicase DeaD